MTADMFPVAVLADGGETPWGPISDPTFMPSNDALVAILAGGTVAMILLVVAMLLAWRSWRRLRRGAAVQSGLLTVRAAFLAPGPRRDTAALRRELALNVAQTERILAVAAPGSVVADLVSGLLPRLQATTSRLDEQLQLLHTEPNTQLLNATLPAMRARAQRIVSDTVSLRQTALRLMTESDELQRRTLEQDLHDELAGLHAGLDAVGSLRPGGDGATR